MVLPIPEKSVSLEHQLPGLEAVFFRDLNRLDLSRASRKNGSG